MNWLLRSKQYKGPYLVVTTKRGRMVRDFHASMMFRSKLLLG
jgi:hypothetical protein